jgi:bacteriocin biosynthesis cyclodehydratase domain-containing protein
VQLDALLLDLNEDAGVGSPWAGRRPLLKPWYRLAYDGERALVGYGDRVVALEGRAARLLLPRLLPLLDGEHTVAEIAGELGRSTRPAVVHAIAELDRLGLLAEGPAAAADAQALAAVLGGAPIEIERRLSGAAVGVLGEAAITVEAARLLRRAGVGSAERLEGSGAGSFDLVLASGPPAALERWNEVALERGTPWLQVVPYDGRFAAAGPLYVPGETCCRACYALRLAATRELPDEHRLLQAQPGAPSLAPVNALLAAHVALIALRWLAARDPLLPGVLWAIGLEGGCTLTRHEVLRVPRCPACSGLRSVAPPAPWFEGER